MDVFLYVIFPLVIFSLSQRSFFIETAQRLEIAIEFHYKI